MVVRVDEAGKHDVALGVEDLVSGVRQIIGGTHRGDEPVDGEQATIEDLGVAVVHRREDVCVANEEAAHRCPMYHSCGTGPRACVVSSVS